MKRYPALRHYEKSIVVPTTEAQVFAYVNDHARFSSHMNKSSWMMGGGHMDVKTDEGKGQRVGSHIRMSGTVFGIKLFLDEVITEYSPPNRKVWQTVGDLKLLVVGHYSMSIVIAPDGAGSRCTVSIDYKLPTSPAVRILGYLLADIYAKWCVAQMITG